MQAQLVWFTHSNKIVNYPKISFKLLFVPLLLPSRHTFLYNIHIICVFLCSVFKIQVVRSLDLTGGPKWTRTTDLTIISRVL